MSKSRPFLYLMVLCLFAGLTSSAAHASSFTYSFDYSGGSLLGSTATGSGMFTYDSATQALTSFTFSDTVKNSIYGTGVFSYDLGRIVNDSLVLAGDGTLLAADITTAWIPGTNGNLGNVDFSFNYLAGLALDGTTGSKLGDGTVGTGSVRLVSGVAPTPEPSSLLLLGTGIIGIAGAARRRMRA